MILWLSRLRVGLSLLGLLIVIAAIARDDQMLMWVAIGCLGVSVVVRLLLRRRLQDAQHEAMEE
jgi:ABC-type bacteriocin/lantibiotic exporter with double-glycine peptidase domain